MCVCVCGGGGLTCINSSNTDGTLLEVIALPVFALQRLLSLYLSRFFIFQSFFLGVSQVRNEFTV